MEENNTKTLEESGRTYSSPQIAAELELETRAGSSLGLPDGIFDSEE
ncbi:MAG: hypothetical protein ACOY16_11855 [Chloroflexota bacterium]